MGRLSEAFASANSLGEDSFRPYDSITPPLAQGSYRVKIEQQLVGSNNGPQVTVEPLEVWFKVEGTTGKLLPADVLACYPSEGANDVPINFLCHITLKRKTLPWERHPAGEDHEETPWLAVLLLAEGEYTWCPDPNPAKFDRVEVPLSLLAAILPRKNELPLLAHARKLTSASPLSKLDDDGLVAIVIGNRLPEPGKRHRACLIDITGLWDQDVWSAKAPSLYSRNIGVSVLYSWTFQAGQGGDFEGVVHALQDQGGVHPFGVTPPEHRLKAPGSYLDAEGIFSAFHQTASGEQKGVGYRLPLVSTMPAQENFLVGSAADAQREAVDGTPELGCSSAFELGRVMTLTDPEMLGDLLTFRRQLHRTRIRLTSLYASRLNRYAAKTGGGARRSSTRSALPDESEVQVSGRSQLLAISTARRVKARKADYSDLLVACSASGEVKTSASKPAVATQSPATAVPQVDSPRLLTQTVRNGGQS